MIRKRKLAMHQHLREVARGSLLCVFVAKALPLRMSCWLAPLGAGSLVSMIVGIVAL